ncbi:MAG TPA: 6,7-dimethyl-8-ribityllumazine synthase [Leptospiraceae bacterium]|nr:6,7-dimethyl-8-ribityllumazine synthase [Spirochaetaceae bacterium]HBS07157.1 6,7-dimethyl-8-ribityllumazine synthase [Leptospiraceae bacterium]|tara:strand:- start:17825 stop:18289 length:465 start_codon:yes stop_codon:yes gene_type:complete
MELLEGKLNGAGQRHAIVVSRWNEFITDRLKDGAVAALRKHDVAEGSVTVVAVPGAYELGSVAKRLAQTGKYDAITCLGAVIRGATDHYDYVCGQAARLIAQVYYDTGIPTVFGVITTDTIEQAIERAGTKAGNKGYESAVAAVELASLTRQIQ